jgi:hypothetical protein
MKKDMKEALSSGRKPDITHMRKATMVYGGRACEYGDKRKGGKYVRANFRRPTGEGPAGDFLRFREYLRASFSHIADTLEMHEALDPEFKDVEGMKRAMYAEDTDSLEGCPVGPSGLPHVAHAVASINMAITQAVDCGMLPKDPGQPWRQNKRRRRK